MLTLAWFRKRVGAKVSAQDPGSSVVIESLDVHSMRLGRFCRQDHGRVAALETEAGAFARRNQEPGERLAVVRHEPDPARGIDLPDVEITGRLRVVDSARFSQLLLRGVGRHCGMGMGMFRLGAPIRG